MRRWGRSGRPHFKDIIHQEERVGGFRSKIHNNKKRSLGPEQSLSKVGTLPPHDSYIPHGPVASNTHTYIYTHKG